MAAFGVSRRRRAEARRQGSHAPQKSFSRQRSQFGSKATGMYSLAGFIGLTHLLWRDWPRFVFQLPCSRRSPLTTHIVRHESGEIAPIWGKALNMLRRFRDFGRERRGRTDLKGCQLFAVPSSFRSSASTRAARSTHRSSAFSAKAENRGMAPNPSRDLAAFPVPKRFCS